MLNEDGELWLAYEGLKETNRWGDTSSKGLEPLAVGQNIHISSPFVQHENGYTGPNINIYNPIFLNLFSIFMS